VLESLAGISLPRGWGISTRVPLIMRLQHHSDPDPDLSLEYNGRVEHTDEDNISEDIVNATNLIAGDCKGISDTPLTLLVKKNGVPDLTMVDLPGITRVPVRGKPLNIADQIKDMIMKYIKPDESIILNVLSASTDFSTCESISMLRSVDKTGERTLAKINDKLNSYLSELNKMPKKLSSVAEAMTAVMQIIGTSKESLKKILVRGEFHEFLDDKHMHCTARLVEMLNKCSDQLHECNESDPKSNFLKEEIAILEAAK
ncbi:PREDICTED: dynamin-related, partial [Prunus dulcis]